MKRILLTLIVMIAGILLCCCDQTAYYDNSSLDSGFADIAFSNIAQPCKINIDDGSVIAACPDPLCSHKNTATCPIVNTFVTMTVDGGRYMFYIASPLLGSGLSHSVYCFDSEKNTTEKIYTYDMFPTSNPSLVYSEGKLYFDSMKMETDENGRLRVSTRRDVLCYDVNTKQVDVYGEMDENDTILYSENGKLYYRSANGDICRTEGSFDGTDKVPLPEGGKYSAMDYWAAGPGFVEKSTDPAAIYLYNEKKFVSLPPETNGGILYSFTSTGDNYYFLTSLPDTDQGEDGYYLNKICVLNKSGDYKLFTVQCDYFLTLAKGHNDFIMCSVYEEYKNGEVTEPTDDSVTLVRVDLDSGKATLYNGNACYISDYTVGETTFKVERIK